jgi:glycosyltransferase involved in cell wall biosynthesis
MFVDKLQSTEGHRNASLILHTDPLDQEGPNLYSLVQMLKIQDNVVFSTNRVGFDVVNIMQNIADFTINISYAEGFGLSTLEAMQVGTPIIAPLTGGQTRQVVDYRDGSENGFALPIEMQTLVGSQNVPYIYEDYVSVETIADKIWKMYEIGELGRKHLGKKAKNYVDHEFSYQKTVDLWHNTMLRTIKTWKQNRKSWQIEEIK